MYRSIVCKCNNKNIIYLNEFAINNLLFIQRITDMQNTLQSIVLY